MIGICERRENNLVVYQVRPCERHDCIMYHLPRDLGPTCTCKEMLSREYGQGEDRLAWRCITREANLFLFTNTITEEEKELGITDEHENSET